MNRMPTKLAASLVSCLALAGALSLPVAMPANAQDARTGNVIFFHPDGTGVNHWGAARMHIVGPDGELNWDKLPGIGVYTGHMADRLTGTSHGGATVHAYGVKVVANSFGLNGKEEITAASGKAMSIAEEALEAGKSVGLIQSGHIAEPGTAAFVASHPDRWEIDPIAEQVIESGVQVIMAGGERYLLPEGVKGRHGPGERKDGKNMIERAKELGYTVVFTRDELMAIDPAKTDKLLGVFAHKHTFNDQEAERNTIDGVPTYWDYAPTIGEMTDVALKIPSRNEKGFLAVIEEEGTDNIANNMNAAGTLEALRRADEAVGVISKFLEGRDDTLLLMAADSDAGGLQVVSGKLAPKGKAVAASTRGGGRLFGKQGAFGDVFMSAPDAKGVSHPFGISFIGYDDVAGGIVVRAAGLNADLVKSLMDNTDIYALMYKTLFGKKPEGASQ